METGLRWSAFAVIFGAYMKKSFQVVFLALTAVVVTGCFSRPKIYYHAGDETPPDFLAGPLALLLTNVDGFSAKITGTISSANGDPRTLAGDLLGRQGTLIYQPENSVKGKRARSEGGMFFIWNETSHSGFVLSDPLQAYAPASANVQPTNVVLNTAGAIREEANGHPCRQIEAVVQSNDGSSARFKIWEAVDAKDFPVRIQTAPGPRQTTLNFTDLRLELPPPEVFGPPDGFIKYDTPVALMNELIIRQSSLTKQNEGNGIEISPAGGSNPNNWRPTRAQ
jgi:hypothetical protein